ncbi:protein-disulfide reductase DsbD N-terminal domain-containing protein [Burkholderia ubonensis]|uniref:protein-disulfide reductase DsbD N-terminal domain-containing protein n=1 Tax=Burkholderia ubonensis TaxID=101571 RepID=UPI001E3E6C79|nr:protein-disulfide reductase DsbD N-terminal domain-containing protein [Burkholderia ubonensis]
MRTISANAYQSDQTADTLSRLIRFALVLLLGFASLAAYAVSESELLAPEQAFPLTVGLASPTEAVLDFKTTPAYYLYRDRFSFAVDGAPVKPDSMPPSETKNDPAFGVVQVYHQPVRIRLPLSAAVTSSAMLTVTSQGCADVGARQSSARCQAARRHRASAHAGRRAPVSTRTSVQAAPSR